MKANGAKRKIFNDAIDLLDRMEEAAMVPENAVRMLPIESMASISTEWSLTSCIPSRTGSCLMS